MRLAAFFAVVALSSANQTVVSPAAKKPGIARTVQQGDYLQFVDRHFGQLGNYDYFLGTSVIQDVDVALAICDKVAGIASVPYQCAAFNIWVGAASYTGDIKQWSIQEGWHSFLHTTRCNNGANATAFTSPRGQLYKYCSNVDPVPVLQGKYSIPLQVCKQTCDLDTSCVGYGSDLSSTCEIYYANPASGWDGYVRMS